MRRRYQLAGFLQTWSRRIAGCGWLNSLGLGLILQIGSVATPSGAWAQSDSISRTMNRPVAPFRVIGEIYYVGAADVTAFLIRTSDGLVLLDGGFVETAPRIMANIRALGFDPHTVRVLLNSHAHYDHAGGLASLKSATAATLYADQGDSTLLANGGRGGQPPSPKPGENLAFVDRPGCRAYLDEAAPALTAKLRPGAR